MPVTIIGDILTPHGSFTHWPIICHQVNCKGRMGSGLAGQIHSIYPNVYYTYKRKCEDIAHGIGGLGDVLYTPVQESNFIIANIFGQDGYGRDKCYTDYDALRKAFTSVSLEFPYRTVRIPYKIGCGLAGGDWDVVWSIITDTLVKNGSEVQIWKLPDLESAT